MANNKSEGIIKSIQKGFRVTKTNLEMLNQLGVEEGVTRSELIRNMLMSYVDFLNNQ